MKNIRHHLSIHIIINSKIVLRNNLTSFKMYWIYYRMSTINIITCMKKTSKRTNFHISDVAYILYIPAFGVFDWVAKHIVKDGLRKVIEFLELCVLLVDDTRQQIQFRNNTGLLRKRRDGNLNR